MQPVVVIDTVGMSAALVALTIVCLRWKAAFPDDVKLLLLGAFLFSAVHAGVNVLGELEPALNLSVSSNYLQLLIPLFWGIFFYAFFQSALRDGYRLREQRFPELWDDAPVACHIVDKHGVLVRVNGTELEMLGYSEGEMLGRPVFDFIVDEQREEAREEFHRRMQGAAMPAYSSRRFLRKDGTQLPVNINYRLECGPEGKAIGVRSTVFSILEETRLREKFKALFEHNPVPTVIVDSHGRVEEFNIAKRDTDGRLPRRGVRMYLDYFGDHDVNMRGHLLECIERREPKKLEALEYNDRFLSVTMAPMNDGAIITTEDVTRLTSREQTAGGGPPVYVPVSVGVIQPGSVPPVDLFVRISPDHYTLHHAAHTEFDEQARKDLVERNIENLYIRKDHEDGYSDYVEDSIDAILRDDLLTQKEACSLLYQSSSQVMADLFNNPRSRRNVRRAERMVRTTVESIMNNPDALWQVMAVASRDYHTCTHSVNVCMFLVASSSALLGIDGQKELEQIGMGGMLHDVGKSMIPDEILGKPGKLSAEEFARVREHPRHGLELVADSPSLNGAGRSIIHHHHESCDASGYPDGLAGDRIRPVARLAKLVDVYDALTTDRCYGRARQPYAALDLMLGPMKSQFDVGLLRRFVRFLGPEGFAPEL